MLAAITTLADLGAALERLRAWPERPSVVMGDCPRCHSSFSVNLGELCSGLTVDLGSPEAVEAALEGENAKRKA